MVSGIPSATVEDVPKLNRMSWRTTPLSVRTLGPLEPSPGEGPAVSSGIGVRAVVPSATEVVAPELLSTVVVPTESVVVVLAVHDRITPAVAMFHLGGQL